MGNEAAEALQRRRSEVAAAVVLCAHASWPHETITFHVPLLVPSLTHRVRLVSTGFAFRIHVVERKALWLEARKHAAHFRSAETVSMVVSSSSLT